ncbi:tetratricopeptide repeat protein [Longitalea arenae]|uniref:tetratricopeptide repeat protein n=1 Tax=Longitalea arenae TaxID=2812558 RepID=UPI00196707B9|nr:CDC27 family protein [Longitalea arenae]
MQANDHITLTIFPFEDLSLQKELGIFCRSFSTDLTTELSRFRQFRIIKLPAAQINADPFSNNLLDSLTTDYFIQGTFRCEKELVRINVQLYNSNTRHMVWGNRFEGTLSGLHAMQDDLLAAVAGVLQHQINNDLLTRMRKRPSVAFGAYEHWLYGMEEVKKGSVESDLKAREHFQKALEIQPDYALAYTGMSMTYFNEWSCQLWERWDVSRTGAYEWAQKAIELDDQNHVTAMVMGKIFLYEESYDTAEFYFRKSLVLNPNDPDTHMQIALCFLLLGKEQEALEIYEKTLQLLPFNTDNYFIIGVLIYFRLGDYAKAASLIKPEQKAKIANADAYYAAIYYYLQQPERMQYYWNLYLETYRKLISRGKDFTAEEAIDWITKINPYRYKTNLDEFLQFISNGHFRIRQEPEIVRPVQPAMENYFLKEAAAWKLSYDGTLVQMPELKGFYDIQKMLREPRQLFHCAELMGSSVNDQGEKLIDEKARKEYQRKILDLQIDLQEAEQRSDFARIEKLQAEYDKLVDHLSRSLGLKGKARESGSTVEKARSALTWRIRNAIARIEQHHPLLGAHLSNAIKTGILCAYQPDRDISWTTEAAALTL